MVVDRLLDPIDLYKVVLAGGGAHIPKIREVVADAMEGQVPRLEREMRVCCTKCRDSRRYLNVDGLA